MPEITSAETTAANPSLLIVDDDKPFLDRLARAMEGRGFTVETASSVAEGLAAVTKSPPAFAVVDMRLGDGSGLDVISALKDRSRCTRPDPHRLRQHRHRRERREAGRRRLSFEARRRRRGLRGVEGRPRRYAATSRKSYVGGSRALGAYPARLRALRPQRFGDRAAAQHAPPHLAADFGEARAALIKRSQTAKRAAFCGSLNSAV